MSWKRKLPRSDARTKSCPGGYEVRLYDRPSVVRPTKLSAGMNRTTNRGRRHQSPYGAALELIVYGTTDPLRRGLTYKVVKKGCEHCGTKNVGGLVLTDRGRLRLRVLRRRAEKREAERNRCGQCEGTGTTDAMGYEEECPVCDGSGTLCN